MDYYIWVRFSEITAFRRVGDEAYDGFYRLLCRTTE